MRSRSRTRPPSSSGRRAAATCLIVGQNDEAALAMMMMGAVSIAAQHPPAGPQACRFYLLDGSPVDSALVRTARPAQDDPAAPGDERHLARPGHDVHRAGRRDQAPAGVGVRRSGADLHLHLRHPAVPRPSQVGRRLRLLARTTRTSRCRRRSSSATSSATGRRSGSTRSSGATASTT